MAAENPQLTLLTEPRARAGAGEPIVGASRPECLGSTAPYCQHLKSLELQWS